MPEWKLTAGGENINLIVQCNMIIGGVNESLRSIVTTVKFRHASVLA